MNDYTDIRQFLSTGPKTPKEIKEYFGLDQVEAGNLTRRIASNKGSGIERVELPQSLLYDPTWARTAEVTPVFFNEGMPRSMLIAASKLNHRRGAILKFVNGVLAFTAKVYPSLHVEEQVAIHNLLLEYADDKLS